MNAGMSPDMEDDFVQVSATDGAMQVETTSVEETRAFGEFLACFLCVGDFIALDGELGAGKTSLVQGLAAGLKVPAPVTSPTFTLLHLYEGGRLPLYHFDAYRLASPEELEGLGYEEYFYGDGVCVIEWGRLAEAYLPARRIRITLEQSSSTDSRRITLAPYGGEEDWRRELLRCLSSYRDAAGIRRRRGKV